jgi:hypothetical protein
MWQSAGNLKISLDFAVLGKVIRNGGRFLDIVPWDGDRRVVDFCLTLITSKPRFISPSELSSARVLMGRWRITAWMCFSDFGWKVK